MTIVTVGIDLAKNVFAVHGVDETGKPALVRPEVPRANPIPSVVDTGESFMAPSTGLQAALWRLGGVPEKHRTDSLSAALNHLAEEFELTRRYDDLCRHYGMRASRGNPGQSNENGPIESRHDPLKSALDHGCSVFSSSLPCEQ